MVLKYCFDICNPNAAVAAVRSPQLSQDLPWADHAASSNSSPQIGVEVDFITLQARELLLEVKA